MAQMNTAYDQIWQLREQALDQAQAQSRDFDDMLDLEALFFEGLLGNWLLDNPDMLESFRTDPGWQEELEDLLPIGWDEFLSSVDASKEIA